jgi:hypothetical protein
MSQKITSKNLAYNAALPPFLAAMKERASAPSDIPDPILAKQRRCAKKRSASEEAEDAPLIVDENGNEINGRQLGDDDEIISKGEGEGRDEPLTEKSKEVERTANIGASKKRKVAKVIGPAEDNDKEAKASSSSQDKAAEEVKSSNKMTKKKPKKIKLSFDDD